MYKGKIEIHAPGQILFKGADYDFSGPMSMNVPPVQFPSSELCIECLMKAIAAGSGLSKV
jgi:uncharacterized protein (DUF2345 family)